MKFAEDAKANCPVSKALSAVEITLSATLPLRNGRSGWTASGSRSWSATRSTRYRHSSSDCSTTW